MKIIGLRIEKYIDSEVSGHNCDFTYSDAEFEKHIICGVLSDNRKVIIELSRSEGECGSGWTTASFGHINVTEVSRFYGYTHVPKNPIEISDYLPGYEGDTDNDVFHVSCDGGDSYYPSGGYGVKMDLFNETPRAKTSRPVWIIIGKSGSGKSYLSSKLYGLDVYETDSNEDLPASIKATVVVLGNKYNHSIEEITTRLFGKVEVQVVEFK